MRIDRYTDQVLVATGWIARIMGVRKSLHIRITPPE